MKSFEHVNATSVASAIRLLGHDGHGRFIAGGTDLLTILKGRVSAPDRLVNLKTIPGLRQIDFDEASGLRIGGLATLVEIADSDVVRERYPALRRALTSAASPQLRNVGTIGGNFVQESRCWYYRGPHRCWLKGGEVCYARDGENSHHAIFAGGPCFTVQPSDPAPALVALGAQVRIIGPFGERTLPLEQLFQRPREASRQLTILRPGAIVVEVGVPTPPPGSRGLYLKAMGRQTWTFALASVAAQLSLDGDVVREVRLVLGGVAPMPWQVRDAEAALRGQRLDETAIDRAAEAATAGAQPLRHNGYKVHLVAGLVREALAALR